VLWWPMSDEEIGETMKHVVRSEPPGNDYRKAAPRKLVQHHEHAELPAILGAVLDEVVRPDMVRPLRSQTDARPIVEPETAPFRLLHGNFQPRNGCCRQQERTDYLGRASNRRTLPRRLLKVPPKSLQDDGEMSCTGRTGAQRA